MPNNHHRKRKKKTGRRKKKQVPFVSVCTPTFNRRPFFELCLKCLESQTYPHNRMEWIVLDDGTDPVQDIVDEFASRTKINVRYFRRDTFMPLAQKRNFLNDKADGAFICYWDDDDFYQPNRIEASVKALQANPQCMVAAGSAMYCYFNDTREVWKLGPYSPNHSTAAVMMFRKELLLQTRFTETECMAEEKAFLKNYTIPAIQLPPGQTIVVIAHSQNSFDKRSLIAGGNNKFVHKTKITLDQLIRDHDIRDFIVSKLESKLAQYTAGDIRNKPDVLVAMLDISRTRMKQLKEEYSKLVVAHNQLVFKVRALEQQQASNTPTLPTPLVQNAPAALRRVLEPKSSDSQPKPIKQSVGQKKPMRGIH